jgi:hypothetical protein
MPGVRGDWRRASDGVIAEFRAKLANQLLNDSR